MNLTYYWAIIGTIVAVYAVLSTVLPEKLRKKRISDRDPLSFDLIYSKYLSDLGYEKDLLRNLWYEVASKLKLDPEKLRPSDRFDNELSVRIFPLVDLNEDIAIDVQEKVKAASGRVNLEQVNTLRDYVVLSAHLDPK